MDARRAAEVLRSIIWRKSKHVSNACEMGAQSLEAWAWVERHVSDIDTSGSWRTGDGWAKVYYDDGQVVEGATVYAAVLDAMEKEKR